MGEPPFSDTNDGFRAEQQRILLGNSVGAALVNGAIAAIAYAAVPSSYTGWLVCVLAAALLRLLFWAWQGRRRADVTYRAWWGPVLVLLVACQGGAWGFAGVQLFHGTSEMYRFYVLAIVCGMTAGSAQLLAPSFTCFTAFALPATGPLLYLLLSSEVVVFFHAGLMGIVFVLAVHGAAWRMNHSFREQVALRIAHERTALELQRHKTDLESLVRERTEALETAKESYRRLIEEVNDAVFEVDREGVFTYMSPVAEQICGRPAEDFVGRPFHEFILAEDLPLVQRAFGEVLAGGLNPTEYRILDRDGKPHWVRSSSRPATKGAEVLGIRGTVTDLEGIKRAEAERRRAEEQLQQARKLEAVGTLAGGVAHEFNNILAAVLGFAELGLLNSEKSVKVREYFSNISLAVLRGRDIVSQILAFSRPQANPADARDAAALLREGLRLLAGSVPPGVRVVETCEPGAGSIRMSPAHFQQVIANLCTNAWLASGDEGLVEVSLRSAVLGDDDEETGPHLAPGSYVVLEVRDHGTGMDRETLSRVFEPFYTTRKTSGGTGLGLAVVHGIVEAHSGHIALSSVPGFGTTATVFLPAADRSPSAEVEDVPAGAAGANERVLVVDDEPALVEIMREYLQQLGYQAEGFSDPCRALERVRGDSTVFDLVITDLTMPQMDGIEFAREVDRERPGTPILLHTGHLESPQLLNDMPPYIRGVLNKPLRREELAKTLTGVLSVTGSPVA